MTAHPRVLALVADERTPDESMPRATGCTLGCGGEATPSAALLHHVGHVLGMRSQVQMIGPHARRIVATVTDLHAIRDGAYCEGIGRAVGMRPSAIKVEAAVSGVITASPEPQPATIRVAAVHAQPEARECVFDRAILLAGARAEALPTSSTYLHSSHERFPAPFTRGGDSLPGHCGVSFRDVTPPDVDASRGHFDALIVPHERHCQ